MVCACRNRFRADLIQARKSSLLPPCPPVIMTRLGGKRILETSWELLLRDQQDFLLATKASQGDASFVDVGGKRGLSVAEAICLEELCGPKYAAQIAVAALLEPGCTRQLHWNMCILAKEAKAIRFSHITAISITKFLCSPMLGKRPKLVRIGSAAALAEVPPLATRVPWAVRWRRRPATLSVRA